MFSGQIGLHILEGIIQRYFQIYNGEPLLGFWQHFNDEIDFNSIVVGDIYGEPHAEYKLKRCERYFLFLIVQINIKSIETSLGDPRKIKKSEQPTRTFNPKPILAQIPRYAYLLTIFALLAGIFFPLITPGVPFDHAIQGIATLSLGLVGGILLFKAATSDNRRGIFIAVGFALIAISLVLIYHIQDTVRSLYY